MLYKKSLLRGYTKPILSLRLILILSGVSLLTSCTTFIPGLDRVLFSNSSAKVGPLVPAEQVLPESDGEDEADLEDQPLVTAEAEPSEPSEKVVPEPKQQATTSASPPAETMSDSQRAALPPAPTRAPSVTENQPAQAKVEPKANDQTKSMKTGSAILAAKQGNQEFAVEYGSVTGNVVLVGDEQQALSATGTMVTLTPKTMMNKVQNRPSQVHIIDMENKEYQPRYSTIQSGDQVVFVNKDNIQHNVFSSSGSNAFDLGTYGAGLKRAVTLKEPGIVKVYCNIHSDMVSFVAVGDQGLSVKADDQGRYQIDKVLPGSYEIAIWNIRGETKRIIDVRADEVTKLVDRIDTKAFKAEPHKNKFGGDYSTNSALFEDEFY